MRFVVIFLVVHWQSRLHIYTEFLNSSREILDILQTIGQICCHITCNFPFFKFLDCGKYQVQHIILQSSSKSIGGPTHWQSKEAPPTAPLSKGEPQLKIPQKTLKAFFNLQNVQNVSFIGLKMAELEPKKYPKSCQGWKKFNFNF